MMEIEEASENDFDQVYLLLQRLNNTTIEREIWGDTFKDLFDTGEPPGFLLRDGEKVVGFFGTVFSRRIINGKNVKFCNCHSWVVDDKYRSHGLKLLSRIHKLKACVITNFSASAGPYQIMKKLKWKEIDNAYSIFFMNPLRALGNNSIDILKGEEMRTELESWEQKIVEDHQRFRCTLNTIKTGRHHSLQVYKSIDYFPARLSALKHFIPWRFRMGQLYYASTPELFFDDFKSHLTSICKKENWVGLVVPNRLLHQAGIAAGKRYYKNRPVLVKTDLDFDTAQLDLLYSEVFILDLN